MRTMRTSTETKGLGNRVRRLRLALGMSQEELAAPHYTAAYISHIENDKRMPSDEVVAHLADKLGVSEQQLVTGREPDADVQLRIAVDRAVAQVHTGDLAEAEETLLALRKKAHRDGLGDVEAIAIEGVGLVEKRKGNWVEARALFEEAEGLLANEPPEARTSLITSRAWSWFMTGEIREAIHILETHLIELNVGDAADPNALLQTYSYLIGPYFEAGLKERATDAADKAARLEVRVQDPEAVACMNINRAQILIEQGHRAQAMRALARARDLFQQLGWRDSAAKAAVAQATAAVDAGDLQSAAIKAETALVELQDSPSALDKARVLNLLANRPPEQRARGRARAARRSRKAARETAIDGASVAVARGRSVSSRPEAGRGGRAFAEGRVEDVPEHRGTRPGRDHGRLPR